MFLGCVKPGVIHNLYAAACINHRHANILSPLRIAATVFADNTHVGSHLRS